MWRYAIGFVLVGVGSAHVLSSVDFQNRDSGQPEQQQAVAINKATDQRGVVEARGANDYGGRTARIEMDNRGHFETIARMNGQRVEVLVDTGATSVAINRSTARQLGIILDNSDFKYTVNTANGQTKAAGAVIERIEIGRVEVRNVRAAVLEDSALSGTLLGMSFLGELRSFEVRNRELVLTQ